MSARAAPGDGLLHPMALAAIATLLINDHVLKRACPSALTGKLSDVAGLVFFPLLLQGVFEIASARSSPEWRPSRRAIVASVVATLVVFTLAKTWAPVNDAVRVADGALHWPVLAATAALRGAALPGLVRASVVLDPTDLFALPALSIALAIGLRRAGLSPRSSATCGRARRSASSGTPSRTSRAATRP